MVFRTTISISIISLCATLKKVAIPYSSEIFKELSYCKLKELIISGIPTEPIILTRGFMLNAAPLPDIESLESLTLEIAIPRPGSDRKVVDIVGHYKYLRTLTLRGSGDQVSWKSLRLWNFGGLAVQLRRLNLIGPWHLDNSELLAMAADFLSVSKLRIPWNPMVADPPISHLKSIELHDTNPRLLTCFNFPSLEQVLISNSWFDLADTLSRISADCLKTLIIKSRRTTEPYYTKLCVYDFARFVELENFWSEGYQFEPDDLRTFFKRILPFMRLVYLSPQEV
jgi:hypothetical protein